MKKILFSSLVFVFAFVVVGGAADAKKSEKAQGPHEKATGSITAMAGSTSLELIFDAHGTDPVKGNVEYSNSSGKNFSGPVNICYYQDGNKAAFSGEITDGTYDQKYFLIEVIDNGEGENADGVDAVRVRVDNAKYKCEITNKWGGKVVDGNLQVHQVKEVAEEMIIPEIMSVMEDEESKGKKPVKECTTIQSAELVDSNGDVITTGYSDFGYNYQAHIYNGEYAPGWNLVMKWSDSWLSNKDCDGDGLLDRHLGYDTYIGSGAWLTNHWTTIYTNDVGEVCEYDEFMKIVAVPVTAFLEDEFWYNSDGVEIGESIWGQFAIIQYVVNDPCEGIEGVQYKSPDHPGLGNWADGEFMETITVPVTDGIGIETNFSTEEGKEYRLDVSGTYRFANWGDYGIADAEWAYRNDRFSDPNAEGWTPGETTYPSIKGLDVLVDSENVDWGSYSSLHEYSVDYVGTGESISFSIFDSAYGDNSPIDDGLVVNIYKVH